MNRPRKNQNNWRNSFYFSPQLTKLTVNEEAMLEILRCIMDKTCKKLNDDLFLIMGTEGLQQALPLTQADGSLLANS